jgi:hypothetical protein
MNLFPFVAVLFGADEVRGDLIWWRRALSRSTNASLAVFLYGLLVKLWVKALQEFLGELLNQLMRRILGILNERSQHVDWPVRILGIQSRKAFRHPARERFKSPTIISFWPSSAFLGLGPLNESYELLVIGGVRRIEAAVFERLFDDGVGVLRHGRGFL